MVESVQKFSALGLALEVLWGSAVGVLAGLASDEAEEQRVPSK